MKYIYRTISVICQSIVFGAICMVFLHLGLQVDLSTGSNWWMVLSGAVGGTISTGLAILANKFDCW